MSRVTITKEHYERLRTAEEFCRAARQGYSTVGVVGWEQYPWFERWMSLAPESKYDDPLPLPKQRSSPAAEPGVATALR